MSAFVHRCVSPRTLYVCVCVDEAANHRLIGAIRVLAEHNHIAAPDGQLEVDTTHAHDCKTHTYTHVHIHA